MSTIPTRITNDPRDAYFDVSGLQENLGRQTGRSASVILLFALFRLAITLVTVGFLARLVPPEEHGQVAMVVPVILIAAGLSEFGLPQAVIQQQYITHRVVSALFWINFALGLILTAVAAALAPLATSFYGVPEVFLILIVLSPYILITVMTVPYVAILRRRMQIRVAETCSILGVVLSSVFAILAAMLGAGVWALVIQLLVAQVASLVFFMVAVRWRPSAPWNSDLKEARSAVFFGGYLSLDRLLAEVTGNLQTVIIGRAFGNIAAGLYYRSYTFADMPRRRFVGPLAGAFVPSLSRLQADPAAFRDMYVRQVSRGNLIMIPVGLIVCLASDMFVSILLGKDWLLAIPVLAWLGSGPLMALFADANVWVMVAMGKPKQLLKARFFSSLFLVAALIGAAQFDLVTFVALFVIAQALVTFLYMPFVIIRHTPITLSVIREAIGADILFCIVMGITGLLVRLSVDLGPIVEGVLVGVLICAVQGARILLTAQYRQDVVKIFRR